MDESIEICEEGIERELYQVPSVEEISGSESSGGDESLTNNHNDNIDDRRDKVKSCSSEKCDCISADPSHEEKKCDCDEVRQHHSHIHPDNDVKSSDSAMQSGPQATSSFPIITTNTPASSFDNLVGRVIGSTNLMELVACPCCQQCYDDTQPGTLNEPDLAPFSCTKRHLAAMSARGRSLLNVDSNDDDDDIEEDEDVLPGVLSAGVQYMPKKILVEGWVHKKGTGKDWLGSRSWKARWARLALARVDGYDFDVPLFLLYWYPASTSPSTVIVLDSTIVLAIDLEDKTKWNSHRFDIRHVQKECEAEPLATRTFTCPRKGRDAWVLAISQALLAYEKQKDKSRKKKSMHAAEEASRRSQRSRSLSPERPTSPKFNDVWTGDRFVKVEIRRTPSSPPTSPTQHRPHRGLSHPASPPIPRPVPNRRSLSTPPLHTKTPPATPSTQSAISSSGGGGSSSNRPVNLSPNLSLPMPPTSTPVAGKGGITRNLSLPMPIASTPVAHRTPVAGKSGITRIHSLPLPTASTPVAQTG